MSHFTSINLSICIATNRWMTFVNLYYVYNNIWHILPIMPLIHDKLYQCPDITSLFMITMVPLEKLHNSSGTQVLNPTINHPITSLPFSSNLHWLAIRSHIIYNALHNLAPTYLADLFVEYTPSRTMCSSSAGLLKILTSCPMIPLLVPPGPSTTGQYSVIQISCLKSSGLFTEAIIISDYQNYF